MMNNGFVFGLMMNPTAKPILTEEALSAIAWDKCTLSHPTWAITIAINPLILNGIIDQIYPKINLKSSPSIILTSVLFLRWVANVTLGQKNNHSKKDMDHPIKNPKENTQIQSMCMDCGRVFSTITVVNVNCIEIEDLV